MNEPGESTPLSSGLQSLNAVQGMATRVMTKENAEKAGVFAKEKAKDLKKMASDGAVSIRMLALLGGITLTIASAMEFLGNVASFQLFSALLDFYTFSFGLVIVVLEGRKIPKPPRLEHILNKYFLFSKFVWGRGCLYFFAGTLQFSQRSTMNICAGGFLCIVGIIYIVVGRKASKKLSDLRKELYSEHTLSAKFHESDSTGSGTLNVNEFKYLTQSLGMDLNKREIEAAFLQMVETDDGELTYDDFKTWWAACDIADAVGI